jgi:crossover junction endodeoxyribonuclease RusA
MEIFYCTLPFPPSVNGLFGGGSKQRRFPSKQYKAWQQASPDLILPEDGMIDYPVAITYTFYLPDKRKRDLSNYIKAPEDYLVKHCIIEDDNHTIVVKTILEFGGIDRDNPRVEISIDSIN